MQDESGNQLSIAGNWCNLRNSKRFRMKTLLKTITAVIGILLLSSAGLITQTSPWNAPKESDALVNPLKNNTASVEDGKKLYVQLCVVCHGDKGKGNGVAAAGLTPKPADHSGQKCQSQTDGAIYWKLTNGRPPMASYKTTLKDEQRWALVNYIRTLAAPDKKSKGSASK